MEGVSFTALLIKVSSTADGGWRLTFDVSGNDRDAVLKATDYLDELVQMALVPVTQNGTPPPL